MGKYFGRSLRAQREKVGLSGNRLAQLSGISQSNLNAIELGKRPPSVANLEALAEVQDLGVSLELLEAWVAADKAGDDGLSKIKKFGLLDGGLDVPDDIEDEPDDWEREVLIRTGAATAHDYSSQSDFWYLPKHERRAILENLDEIWRENQELMRKMRKRG